MCGIAGIFRHDRAHPVDLERLEHMARAQRHRGPDGNRIWSGPGIGLAHQRLAIIDPASSLQPMESEDGRFCLVFNGALYNFRELRRTLEARGHRFRTQGDTEILLHGYREWGEGLVQRLNGMFAFVIYDREHDVLFCARDRLGQKPLHFAQSGNKDWKFASEINGLNFNSQSELTISLHAIEDYFAFGYVPDDRCIYDQVHKLPAGHMLTLQRGGALEFRRYWDADFSQRSGLSTADLVDALREKLTAAVARHCVADVPIGSFLSGGIDSSAITTLMAETAHKPAAAHSVSFEDGAGEGEQAAFLAQILNVYHHVETVRPPTISEAAELIGHFGEPFADASALGMMHLAASARADLRVALTGDGADEAFAGYRRHRFHIAEEQARRCLPIAIRAPLFGALGAAFPQADWAPIWLRGKSTLQALGTDAATAYARAVAMLYPEQRAGLFSASFQEALGGYQAEERYRAAMSSAPARTALDHIQYADLKISLPAGILTKVDRTSMAAGLEVRSPFLDNEIIDFAMQLPDAARLRRGEGKWLLKAATIGMLPDAIRQRPKLGFVPPVTSWFRGPLAPVAKKLAHSAFVTETGWFRPDWIETIVRAHLTGRSDWGRALWQLCMFSLWFDRHFGQDSAHQ